MSQIGRLVRPCETCRAWWTSADYEPDHGECRRRAPVVVQIEPGVTDHEWPVVRADQWCCEWLPVEEPQ